MQKNNNNVEGAWKYDIFLNSLTTAPVINWLFQELGSLEVFFAKHPLFIWRVQTSNNFLVTNTAKKRTQTKS